jgi:hypothetical protein
MMTTVATSGNNGDGGDGDDEQVVRTFHHGWDEQIDVGAWSYELG